MYRKLPLTIARVSEAPKEGFLHLEKLDNQTSTIEIRTSKRTELIHRALFMLAYILFAIFQVEFSGGLKPPLFTCIYRKKRKTKMACLSVIGGFEC